MSSASVGVILKGLNGYVGIEGLGPSRSSGSEGLDKSPCRDQLVRCVLSRLHLHRNLQTSTVSDNCIRHYGNETSHARHSLPEPDQPRYAWRRSGAQLLTPRRHSVTQKISMLPQLAQRRCLPDTTRRRSQLHPAQHPSRLYLHNSPSRHGCGVLHAHQRFHTCCPSFLPSLAMQNVKPPLLPASSVYSDPQPSPCILIAKATGATLQCRVHVPVPTHVLPALPAHQVHLAVFVHLAHY